jgi:ABC-2 type transport system permease protein
MAMALIAIPYVLLVTEGTGVVAQSLLLLIILGTCVVLLSGGIGMFVSSLSPINIVSVAVSVVIVLILIAPTQLPPSVTDLKVVHWFTVVNPITAAVNFQSAVIVDGEQWTDKLSLLVSPLLSLVLVVGAGVLFLDRNLSLRGGLKQ